MVKAERDGERIEHTETWRMVDGYFAAVEAMRDENYDAAWDRKLVDLQDSVTKARALRAFEVTR